MSRVVTNIYINSQIQVMDSTKEAERKRRPYSPWNPYRTVYSALEKQAMYEVDKLAMELYRIISLRAKHGLPEIEISPELRRLGF